MAEDQDSAEVVLKISLPPSARAGILFVETHHSLLDTVSDIKEALAATNYLNRVTNYHLVHGDRIITAEYDDFATLAEIFGESPGSLDLSMSEKPYNLKDVYEHLLRFRELIGMNFFDRAARAHGIGAGGVKINSLGLRPVNGVDKPKSDSEKDNDNDKDSDQPIEISDEDRSAIKNIVNLLIDAKPAALEDFVASETVLSKWKPAIKSLTVLQWSVPPQQRLKGDLLYLQLTTWESETFSITCHVSGFFVNRLSNANFDPSMKVNEKGVFHKEYILYNLVSDLSPKFLEIVAECKEKMSSSSSLIESFLIPSQTSIAYPWAVSDQQVKESIVPDSFKAHIPVLTGGVDGAEAVKDWNDEYQGIKEFSREAFNERLLRDKLINKYIQEFNSVAVSTALDIVKGNISPLNPNESRDKHIYLRNNIFYSYGVNATGAHDNTGGDEAARYCFNKDLNTVKLMNRLDLPGVSNLLTCIVDFLGERIICQAPVPGVFAEQVDSNGELLDKIVHGYSVESNKIYASDDFNEIMKPLAEAFHLKLHKVELQSGASTDKELVFSKDTKGIVGTDNRKYLIDLYRATPLDVEFLDAHYDGSETSYPHKEASLRHDAVEEWYRRKAAAYFKVETERLEKEQGDQAGADGEKPKIAIPYDQIVLNPDAFTGVNENKEDQQAVREVSSFVKEKLVPEFLEDVTKSLVPYDGAHLTAFMHRNGINVRYLGHMAEEALKKAAQYDSDIAKVIAENEAEIERRAEEEKRKKEEAAAKETEQEKTESTGEKEDENEGEQKKEQEKRESAAKLIPLKSSMNALYEIAIQEMIARGVKHIVRAAGALVPQLLKPHFVAHLHNCLLGGPVNEAPEVNIDDSIKHLFTEDNLAFTSLKPADVVKKIETEVFKRFRFHLPQNWVVDHVKPLPLMREIARKVGIQWKAQTYFFTKEELDANNANRHPGAVSEESVSEQPTKGKKKHHKKHQAPAETKDVTVRPTTFIADDILAFVPIVKDSSYRCSLVDEVYETARIHFEKGESEVGDALMSELISFYGQIYGSVSLETTSFYSTLSQFYTERKMHAEASIAARKALALNERLTGVDSYETINAYIKASYFDSLNDDHVSAFKLNGKAVELWSLVYGENHPNTVNTLSNFGTILQEFKLIREAKAYFEKALELSIRINGDVSDISALIRHRLGVCFVQDGNFKGALDQFSKAADVFNKVVGPDDVLSKECSNFVAQIKTYIAYNDQKLAEKRKHGHQSNGKVKSTGGEKQQQQQQSQQPAGSKNGKKKKSPSPVPEIATKSVDEILQFIEGNGAARPKNKRR